jgi:hypothetical protein
MDLFDLSGHVAVVTGGNRGIGLGMARGLAKAGAAVAVWGRDEERNDAAVAELGDFGSDAVGIVCDVADPDDIAAAMVATIDHHGKVDSFFANAGTTGATVFEDMTLDEWRRVIDVNLTGVFVSTQAAARRMIEQGDGGSIVITTSVAARLGIPQSPHYTASKGAAMLLGKAEAVRLARFGIRVNMISPGWVDTEMTVGVQAHQRSNEMAMSRTPQRRWGTPGDFEGAAVFLASEASAFMTGAELLLDGGFSAG